MPVTKDGFVYVVADGYAAIGDGSNDLGNGVIDRSVSTLHLPPKLDGFVVKKTLYRAFGQLGQLRTAVLPTTLEFISGDLFINCVKLKSVYFQEPSNIKIFYGWAFSGCASLESICLPSSITYIGKNFFAGSSALSDVFIPSPNCNIDDEYNLEGNPLVRIHVPRCFQGTYTKSLECLFPSIEMHRHHRCKGIIIFLLFL